MALFFLLCFSSISLLAYVIQFRQAMTDIAPLVPLQDDVLIEQLFTSRPVVSVIVPAYNEATNIQACVTSILNSTKLSPPDLEVWVVDDQSTDATWSILKALQQQLQDPRLHLLAGQSPPPGEVWVGKNWACAQGVTQANGTFLLFIDADVRLKPGAIEAAIQSAQAENIGLLNSIPEVVCGSLAEWLVQPLIFISLVISFNQPAVKNPNQERAYAAGPFMLFQRLAYEQVGGHRAVAHEVAEDVALARAIKRQRFKLQHRLGAQAARLRMYTSWPALWEGWTKVLYVGSWRNGGLTLLLAIVMLSLYTLPWLGLGILVVRGIRIGWQGIDGVTVGVALVALGLQYSLRRSLAKALHCSTKYWWLQGFGGALVAVIAVVSIIKGKTGWGWTWRGRPLQALSTTTQPQNRR